MSQNNNDQELAAKIVELDHKMEEMADILDRVADRLIDMDKTLRQLKDDERKILEELRDLPDDLN